MWVLIACYWGSVKIILKGALKKYRVAQKSVTRKHSVVSHFMPVQSYASQFVKRYRSVVSCVLNPQDFISKKKNMNLASNKDIYNVLLSAFYYTASWLLAHWINRLTPNDPYMGRTAPLTSKRCILFIYSTNICTEYFKHALYSPFFFLFKMQFVS